ncbi:hypothetical protein EUGRSUZ_B00873 [Eucalyptus grandis]|uniref:Uncharacterized protein n=2 Tax=Eucalyptus grandis TaxID=71139 RepID=A0ACC3LQI9_EUCGR|nr:hypothetical protein EUGRSUZ_B00873 [Eucalyptus grandis]
MLFVTPTPQIFFIMETLKFISVQHKYHIFITIILNFAWYDIIMIEFFSVSLIHKLVAAIFSNTIIFFMLASK